ncbi:MAG: hypothetical protein QOD85_2247 [Gaiellaceae bacterium]|jgi:hypothetical protein|nr:hypothetical protein [Gaiellaceae bacterium]
MALRPRILVLLLVAFAAVGVVPSAFARGGNYAFDGGTRAERIQVQKALSVSAFDWSLVQRQVTIHIESGIDSSAAPGEIWLDAGLLDSGRFAWGVAQHEYAHQVDFSLLNDGDHVELARLLGVQAWCSEAPGLEHSSYGCERFASTLAWAYWPNADNCMSPSAGGGESAGMAPAAFRSTLGRMLHLSVLHLRRPGQ